MHTYAGAAPLLSAITSLSVHVASSSRAPSVLSRPAGCSPIRLAQGKFTAQLLTWLGIKRIAEQRIRRPNMESQRAPSTSKHYVLLVHHDRLMLVKPASNRPGSSGNAAYVDHDTSLHAYVNFSCFVSFNNHNHAGPRAAIESSVAKFVRGKKKRKLCGDSPSRWDAPVIVTD